MRGSEAVAGTDLAVAGRSVEGNSRLTAGAGAVIFVLLAAEGVTVPSVSQLLTWHAVIGMILVPIVVLKIASTMYRFGRYYTGDADYLAKGPPHPVLRALGPVVTVLTVALLGTGIVLLLGGRSFRNPWRDVHQLVFFAWFAAMTLHALGHIVETVRVAPRDWVRSSTRVVAGSVTRRVVLVAAIVAGVALGFAVKPSVDRWRGERGRDRRALVTHARSR